MPSFLDAYLQGRNEARAKRGAPPLSRGQWDAGAEHEFEPQGGNSGDDAGHFVEPEAVSRERDAEFENMRLLLAEVTERVEQQKARIAELEGVAAPLVAVLLMPGVKTGLLNRFHPDKHPDADEGKRAAYNEALRVINDAYAIIDQIQASE